jgi:hypothetical protein
LAKSFWEVLIIGKAFIVRSLENSMELERRFKFYEEMINLDGLKVVDSSFFGFSWGQRNNSRLDFGKRTKVLKEGFRVCNFWAGYIDERVTFPEETINEANRFNVHMRRLSRRFKRASGSGNDRIRDFRIALRDFLNCQKGLLNYVLEGNRTEDLLNSESNWESQILPAVIEVSNCEGVKVKFNERYGMKDSTSLSHTYYDERIFAKSLDLSKDFPVTILTRDSDYNRIFTEVKKRWNHLKEKYGIDDEKHDLKVVFFHEESERYYIRDGTFRAKEVSLRDYR